MQLGPKDLNLVELRHSFKEHSQESKKYIYFLGFI